MSDGDVIAIADTIDVDDDDDDDNNNIFDLHTLDAIHCNDAILLSLCLHKSLIVFERQLSIVNIESQGQRAERAQRVGQRESERVSVEC